MTRLARFLTAAADTWRQFTDAMGWPVASAVPPPEHQPLALVVEPEQDLLEGPPHGVDVPLAGRDLEPCHPTSLLDRVLPLDQCDFEHADRIHRTYVRTTT